MRVRAKKLLFIYNQRKRPGEVFELKPVSGIGADGKAMVMSPEKQFSEICMEKVGEHAVSTEKKTGKSTPKRTSAPDPVEVDESGSE